MFQPHCIAGTRGDSVAAAGPPTVSDWDIWDILRLCCPRHLPRSETHLGQWDTWDTRGICPNEVDPSDRQAPRTFAHSPIRHQTRSRSGSV